MCGEVGRRLVYCNQFMAVEKVCDDRFHVRLLRDEHTDVELKMGIYWHRFVAGLHLA